MTQTTVFPHSTSYYKVNHETNGMMMNVYILWVIKIRFKQLESYFKRSFSMR